MIAMSGMISGPFGPNGSAGSISHHTNASMGTR